MTLIWKIFQANIGKALDECDMIHQACNPYVSEGTQCPKCPLSTESPICQECPASPESPVSPTTIGSQEIEETCPLTGNCILIVDDFVEYFPAPSLVKDSFFSSFFHCGISLRPLGENFFQNLLTTFCKKKNSIF